jgi:hypothetical protein
LSDTEPIQFRLRSNRTGSNGHSQAASASAQPVVAFNRQELSTILNVYGRKVAEGEWRDYALDFGRETAVFSVFRRASEVPIFRIEKSPKFARKQGAYAVVSVTGLILKRGQELRRVLEVFDKAVRVVR